MCNACLAAGLSRRVMLGAGLAALAAAPLAGVAQAQPARAAETPDAALKLLVEGNARYVSNQMNERDFSAGRAARAQGQAPFAAILGCADSRVAPELAFDQAPGDLFVVRVAGNFVTTDGTGQPGIRRRRARHQGDHGAGPHELRCGQRHRRGAAEGQRPCPDTSPTWCGR